MKIFNILVILFFICIPSFAKSLDQMGSNTNPDITNDLIYSQDVSDTSEASTGTGKSLTIKNALKAAKINVDGTNVGINSVNPTQRLDVVGTVKATAFIGDGSGLTGVAASASDAPYGIAWDGDTTGIASKNALYDKIETISSGVGGWTDGGTNVYTTTTTDNVGIGTTTVASNIKLDVRGNQYISGNLGIGSTNPTNKLVIVGNEDIYVDVNSTTDRARIGSNSSAIPQFMSDYIYLGSQLFGLKNLTFDYIVGQNGNSNTATRMMIAPKGTVSTPDAARAAFKIFGSDFVADQSNYVDFGIYVTDRANYLNSKHLGTGVSIPIYMTYQDGPHGGLGGDTIMAVDTSKVGGNVSIGTEDVSVARLLVIGTDTSSGTKAIQINDSSNANLFTVNNNGNVGVGSVSPISKLQVVGTITATSFSGDGSALTGISGDASGWTDGGTNVYTATTTDNVGIGTTTPSTTVEIVKQSSQHPLMVSSTATGDGDYLIVRSSGNVGIGTTIPIHFLAIRAATVSSLGITNTSSSSSSAGAGIQSISDDNAPVVLGDRLAFYTFGGSADTGDTIANGGAITGYADGTWSATSAPTEVRIEVAPSGSTTRAVALVADSTSNIGIGTTTPQTKLQVVGAVTATSFSGDGSALTGISAGGWVDGGTNIYASPTTDNVAIGTTTPTQKLTVVGTVSATAFVGDGSGLTNLGASAWTDGGTNVYTTTTTDAVAIGTTTPVSGSILTVNGILAGSGSGPMAITNANVGIGTTTAGSLLAIGTTGQATVSSAGAIATSSTVSVADDAYAAGWNGSTNVPTKNAVYDKIETLGGSSGWTDGGAYVSVTTTSDLVGIGTAIPAYVLDIRAAGNDPVLIEGTSANGTEIRFRNTQASAGDWAFGTGYSGAGVGNYYVYENAPSSGVRAVFASGGNVGLGTTQPASAFDVRNTTDNIWSVKSAANTACNTTCISACVAGMDSATNGNGFLACTDATADTCLCAGSN